ncbi:NAD(P)/FAD-dependent oxidoreductase [Alteribacillus iranensis]|uniref:Sarcosine oxidase subunit alpha n=1 Tax=Alteribacillus iranensis TaxID=930128 RepID=A0A1I2BME8_9BACI|nr:NAD(P)/FAD-dependent oxidoreductase [Alteribacillus iranensis]SFE56400.1 sarcosine oxidase subunit alpha [Alteribacillus iranensis]
MIVDVVIIGAGPSGLSAAIEVAQHGLTAAVIDEYYRPGGRLLGQHYEDPNAPPDDKVWDGKKVADELARKAEDLGVHLFTNVTAWSVSGKWKVELTGASVKSVEAKAMLLATGSIEKALPLPGWTLPGTISIGAAQTFTNLHHIAVGKKVMIVGVDPLSLSVMMEMKNTGIDVVGMVLPPDTPAIGHGHSPARTLERLSDVAGLAPNPLLRTVGKFSLTRFPRLVAHALRFNFLKVNGVPLQLRKVATEIEGNGKVEGITLQSVTIDGKITGEPEHVEVDTVCLSAGLYPMVDLAQTAGCPMVDVPELGGTVPLHGPDMSTPVEGLYVAGNITGIEGAKVTIAQGQLAGISMLASFGKSGSLSVQEAKENVNKARDISPLRFMPDIEKGRLKMEEIWKEEGVYERRNHLQV